MTTTIVPLKCVIVGDATVGKREILDQLAPVEGRSSNENLMFDNRERNYTIRNVEYKCTFCAPNGNQEFDRMRPLLYQGTDIFIIAFALDDPVSFENAKNKWHAEITACMDSGRIPFILVGTRAELRKNSNAPGSSSAPSLAPSSPASHSAPPPPPPPSSSLSVSSSLGSSSSSSPVRKLIPKNEALEMSYYIKADMYMECSTETKPGLFLRIVMEEIHSQKYPSEVKSSGCGACIVQ